MGRSVLFLECTSFSSSSFALGNEYKTVFGFWINIISKWFYIALSVHYIKHLHTVLVFTNTFFCMCGLQHGSHLVSNNRVEKVKGINNQLNRKILIKYNWKIGNRLGKKNIWNLDPWKIDFIKSHSALSDRTPCHHKVNRANGFL